MPVLDRYHATLAPALDELLAHHQVPGAVVGVTVGDARVIVAAGTANAATGIDVTPDTLFQIGSVSKLYTATLVLQLVHAGLVELDEPVRGALQEFRVADDSATLSITPRHLLSHSSGVQGDHFVATGSDSDALWRYVSTLDELGQLHEPEDLFSYCNVGYGVLGRLVEEATGDHFARALQRRLLRPLGVTRTVTQAEQAIVHRVAVGHGHDDDGDVVLPWALTRFQTPIAGVVSTAADVLDFARLHLDGGRWGDRQVVPDQAIADMRAAEIDVPGTGDQWGLGWRISHWGDAQVLAEDGDTLGQHCQLRLFPDADAAVVVLTNGTGGPGLAREIVERIAAELFDLTPPVLPEAQPTAERADPARCTGVYERLHQQLAIVTGPDRTLRMTVTPDEEFTAAGMRERVATLVPVDDHRFLATDADTGDTTLVVMIDAEDEPAGTPPAYVHVGKRAHARR